MIGPRTITIVLAGYDEPRDAARQLAETLGLPPTEIVALEGPIEEGDRTSWFDPAGDERTEGTLDSACESLERTIELAAADGSRVQLVGYSQGAAVALLTCLTAATAVERIVSIGGFVVQSAHRRFTLDSRPLDVLALRGTSDSVVDEDVHDHLLRVLRRRVSSLQAAEYPGGHAVPTDVGPVVRAFLQPDW